MHKSISIFLLSMMLSTVNGLCESIPVPVVSDVHVSLDNCFVNDIGNLFVKLPYITPALFEDCIRVDNNEVRLYFDSGKNFHNIAYVPSVKWIDDEDFGKYLNLKRADYALYPNIFTHDWWTSMAAHTSE